MASTEDVQGKPGISVFMWEDGAPFEFLLNQETIFEFPPGMDPTSPGIGPSLLNKMSLMMGLGVANDSIAQAVSALYL